RLRDERRDGVDDDQVHRARLDEGDGDVEPLLAAVWLGDEQPLEVHAEGPGVARVEGVLRVDEGGGAAPRLHLGDGVQGEGRLAARLGAEDLRDATARVAADAEGAVEGQRS